MPDLRHVSRRSTCLLLLGGTLLAAGCGDDAPDSAAVPAATISPTATSPADTAALGTTPAATTPKSTPDASPESSKSGDDGSKKDDAATPTAEASTEAPTPASTPTPTPAKAKLSPSAERIQNEVLQTLTAIEACHQSGLSYRRCASTKRLGEFGAPKSIVKKNRPGENEVVVTSVRSTTFKVIGADRQGTRWVFAKSASGDDTRTCRLESGRRCTPPTW